MWRHLRQEPRVVRGLWLTLAFALVYAWLSFSLVGGETFFDYHSTILPILLAVGVAWEFFRLWRETEDPGQRRLWQLWLIGVLLWVLAEGVWFVAENILKLEFESVFWPADMLWLLGYPFFVAALAYQVRRYRVELPSQHWRRLRWFIVVIGVVTAVLTIGPLLFEFSLQEMLGNWVNIAYVLFDGVVLGLGAVLLAALRGGFAQSAWGLIVAGLGLIALSDVTVFHLDWFNQYYPDDVYTAPSIASDSVYVLGYAVWWLGVYAYRILEGRLRGVARVRLEEHHEANIWPRNRVMLFSDAEGRLIGFSPAAQVLRRPRGEDDEAPPHLEEVLPPSVVRNLEQRLREKGEAFIPGLPLVLETPDGRRISVRLYAQGVRYGDAWRGMNILLLCFDPLGVPDQLTDEQQQLAEHMLNQAGEQDRLARQAVRRYLGEVLGEVYGVALTWLGPLVAQRLMQEVVGRVRQEGWNLRWSEQQGTLSFPDTLNADQAVQMAGALLQALYQGAHRLIDEEALLTAWRKAWEALPEELREFARQHGLLGPLASVLRTG